MCRKMEESKGVEWIDMCRKIEESREYNGLTCVGRWKEVGGRIDCLEETTGVSSMFKLNNSLVCFDKVILLYQYELHIYKLPYF